MPESVIAGDQMGVQSSGVSLISTVDCACGRARLEAMFKQTVTSIFTGPIAHLHIKVDASAVEIETAATARRVLSACGHQRATESPSLLRPHPPHPSMVNALVVILDGFGFVSVVLSCCVPILGFRV